MVQSQNAQISSSNKNKKWKWNSGKKKKINKKDKVGAKHKCMSEPSTLRIKHTNTYTGEKFYFTTVVK